MPPSATGGRAAKLLLLVLGLNWGVNWPIMKIALDAYPPLTMRLFTMTLGLVFLFLTAKARGLSLVLSRKTRVPVLIAGVFNVAGFSVLSSVAQVSADTSRVVILCYTMPIWVSLLASVMLRERIDRVRALSLALCIAGIAILVFPLADGGSKTGVALALAAALCGAFGVVYMKLTAARAEIVVIAFWQFVVGGIAVGLALPIFEGSPHLWPAPWPSVAALLWAGIVGYGIGYILWFQIIMRVPASTASLGMLSVPLIGVAASALVLGERPSPTDLVGFAMIFAASACVLLAPQPAERPSAA